jgi:hypothetical protein
MVYVRPVERSSFWRAVITILPKPPQQKAPRAGRGGLLL